jgi:membrane carboxypeptidase/penicillin-binding protein PbpC
VFRRGQRITGASAPLPCSQAAAGVRVQPGCKLLEMARATQLEAHLSKDEILQLPEPGALQ